MIAAELTPIFTVLYLVLGGALLVVEVIGIRRKGADGRGGGDTLSEHFWWLRKRFAPAAWIMAGFLAWLAYHFAFEGPR